MSTKYLRKIILEELRKVLREEKFGVDTPYGSSETMSMGGSSGKFGVDTPYGSSETMSTGELPTRKAGPCGSGFDQKCKPIILKLQKLLNNYVKYYGGNKIKEDGIRGKETNDAYRYVTNLELKDAPDSEVAEIVVPALQEELGNMRKMNPKQLTASIQNFICKKNGVLCPKFTQDQERMARASLDKSLEDAGAEDGVVRGYDPFGEMDATVGPQSELMKCPSGATRNADGTCPESELNKPIDKTPLKRESLIRKEITKLLKQL